MTDAGTSTNPTPDAAPTAACANGRKIYLHFNGITLTDGTASNAVNNVASWLTQTLSPVPSWRPNSSTRTADIQSVVDGVRARLGTSPVEVVTQRPATGPYVMVVFGGFSLADGGTVASFYNFSTNVHDCGDVVKNDIAWVAEGFNLAFTADLAVGAIGWGLGLDGTNDINDCMCGWSNNCASATGACTLSSNIATQITYAGEVACPNMNPQNEVAAFSTKFCQ